MLEEIDGPDPIIVKPSRGERIQRSMAARQRRKEVKSIKTVHQLKEEKDARERLRAKRIMMRQKKKAS
jgi:hypothetical protein